MKSFRNVPSLFNALKLVKDTQKQPSCCILQVLLFLLSEATLKNMTWLTPEVRELTCCHGDEYQPRTTVLEAVLLGTAWVSSGHGPRLHPCWRSTRGLAIFLHLRMGNSTYLHRKRHKFDGFLLFVCGAQLKAHTLHFGLSPRSEALFSGSLIHKTWSTDKEHRQEGQFQKMNCECVCDVFCSSRRSRGTFHGCNVPPTTHSTHSFEVLYLCLRIYHNPRLNKLWDICTVYPKHNLAVYWATKMSISIQPGLSTDLCLCLDLKRKFCQMWTNLKPF